MAMFTPGSQDRRAAARRSPSAARAGDDDGSAAGADHQVDRGERRDGRDDLGRENGRKNLKMVIFMVNMW